MFFSLWMRCSEALHLALVSHKVKVHSVGLHSGKFRGSHFSSCVHDHKMSMDLIILETYYPLICESGLKMTNGFRCWKGGRWRKCETKGKTTLHMLAKALM